MAAYSHMQAGHTHRGSYCKSVYNINALMSIKDNQCGPVLSLDHVPHKFTGKLEKVIAKSKLEKIVLKDCFRNPVQTLAVLQAMQRNNQLFKVHLDLQLNVYDDACMEAILELISRGVVTSIEVPLRLREEDAERLLDGISGCLRELRIVNLNGSILNERSLTLLQKLLKRGMITKCLSMVNCQGIRNSSLTSKDKDDLSNAEKYGRRRLRMKVHIEWFLYVGHVDINRPRQQIEGTETIRWIFNRATRQKEKISVTFIRIIGLGPWQEYRPGKRRQNETRQENLLQRHVRRKDTRYRHQLLFSLRRVRRKDTHDRHPPQFFQSHPFDPELQSPEEQLVLNADDAEVRTNDRVRSWLESNCSIGENDVQNQFEPDSDVSNFSTASMRSDLMSPANSIVLSNELARSFVDSGDGSNGDEFSNPGSHGWERFSVNAWSGAGSIVSSPNISDAGSDYGSIDEGDRTD